MFGTEAHVRWPKGLYKDARDVSRAPPKAAKVLDKPFGQRVSATVPNNGRP
jgi:hypothetical protein